MQHRGHSRSTTLAKASETPETETLTTPPRALEKKRGRLSNPPQRRLSPNDIRSLISAYQGGATINELAARYGIHRTTVTALLDQHQIPRHSARTNWGDDELRNAAEQYGSRMSLAEVASGYGIDAQTVANRFRRAGIPIRPRRGWPSRHTAH